MNNTKNKLFEEAHVKGALKQKMKITIILAISHQSGVWLEA